MDMKAIKGSSGSKTTTSISEKSLLGKKKKKKKKKKDVDKNNKFLITINVMGSAGPIRFVVNGDDEARAVIETVLKVYGRQGRLPVLGSDATALYLYSANAGFEALKPWEAIGSAGARNFVLCKKETKPSMSEEAIGGKGSSSGWRAWLHKSLSIKILSH